MSDNRSVFNRTPSFLLACLTKTLEVQMNIAVTEPTIEIG